MKAVNPAQQPHRPVLYQETIEYLAPKSSGRYLDCTAGAGGHSFGILEASSPDGQLIALDLDPSAVQLTKERLSPFGIRASVVHQSYLNAAQVLKEKGWDNADGIVLDLGVSMQLDQIERGSFRTDAPSICVSTHQRRNRSRPGEQSGRNRTGGHHLALWR